VAHGAADVDDEACARERRRDALVAADEGGLGQNLGPRHCRGHHRHRGQTPSGGPAGGRVDEVVGRTARGAPLSFEPAARRDRSRRKRDTGDVTIGSEGVRDSDHPRVVVDGRAGHRDVASEVDARAASARRDHLAGHDVGRPTLADSAEVDGDADG
jgi:hypothetical protein